MTATIVDKRAATGALTGLALGDALGFPTEFNDVPAILAKCGPWRQMPLPTPAIVTDDTQMTLAVGRALRTAMDRGVLAPQLLQRPLRQEFVDWYQSPENNRRPATPVCAPASCSRTTTGPGRTPARSDPRAAAPTCASRRSDSSPT